MNDAFWISKMPKYTLCIFIVFNIIAMIFYPGGNMNNPDQVGYSFSHNFFSDLGRTTSHQDPPQNNYISCLLFNFSLLLVGLCFSILFYNIRRAFIENELLSIVATILGMSAGIAFVGVALTPADLFLVNKNPWYHAQFANWAFRLLFGSSFLYSILIFKNKELNNKYAYSFIIFGVMLFLYVFYSQFYLKSPVVFPEYLSNHVLAQKAVVFWIFFSVFTYAMGMSKYLLKNNNIKS